MQLSAWLGGRDAATGTMTAFARREWLFIALVAAFCAIFMLEYPASFAIADECEILSLAYSIAHGTVYPDRAGLLTWNPSMELAVGGHRIVKYSPFHALLLAPAVASDWRLGFLVSAAFFVVGAFAVRAMLRDAGLATDWCILYFILPGMLYYSATLMAAVPSAAMGAVGVALLWREPPRRVGGALALGASVLLHEWMVVFAIASAGVWWLSRPRARRWSDAVALAAGAAPAIIAVAAYNYATTASALRGGYAINGEAFWFTGEHFASFFPCYLASLAFFPVAGLAALSPRWSRGWQTPAVVAAVVTAASLYGYRDGLTSGLTPAAAMLAGAVPGQRFILPASVIACVPAARWLDDRLGQRGFAWTTARRSAALAAFVACFGVIAALHNDFLRANAAVQTAIARAVPAGGDIVGAGEVLKELAPVYRNVRLRQVAPDDPSVAAAADSYLVWMGAPGTAPPPEWTRGRTTELVRARSWAWNRDLWIAWPRDAHAHAAAYLIGLCTVTYAQQFEDIGQESSRTHQC